MKTDSVINSLQDMPHITQPLHLAMGMFDGVHLGHQCVIEAAVKSAHRENGQSAVLTFHPHPSRLLRPENATKLILPREAKRRFLSKEGVDWIIDHAFTEDFSQIQARGFLPYLKSFLPSLQAIYVGENFRFGHDRRGDVPFLTEQCAHSNIRLFSIERVKRDGKPINSTWIRSLLETGKIEDANDLLGYDYTSISTVIPGKQVGRTLGFPTLNMKWNPELRPRFGVYLVKANDYFGIANYGIRPTFGDTDEPLLEIHLLNDTPNIKEGDLLEVQWKLFLRDEKHYDSIDNLKRQLYLDKEEALRKIEAMTKRG